MIFKIRNPVARFLAGLGTFGVIAATVVGALYGVGCLMEPVYARMFPFLYAESGYRFSDHVFMGLMAVMAAYVAASVLAVVVVCARRLGNKFFKPRSDG